MVSTIGLASLWHTEDRKLSAMTQIEEKQINKGEDPKTEDSPENELNHKKENTPLSETIITSEKPDGWSEAMFKLSKPENPRIAEKPPKSRETEKIIHGFKLYHDQETLLIHVPIEVKTLENSELLSAISMFFNRITGKDVKFGHVEGFKCPCVETQKNNIQPIREIARILAFKDYCSPKIDDEWFLKELFNMVHARMDNRNYEVSVPKGNDYTRWVLRDLIRYLGRIKYEYLLGFIQQIPKKQREYMKLRIHDFEKFKSVLSDLEWSTITMDSLNDAVNECKAIKSSVLAFKQFDYHKFMISNAKVAVDTFGKACIAMIYTRIKERNALRLDLVKAGKVPNVPLRSVLENLRKKGIYAGIHLLPAVLKFRQGDLPILQRITTIQGDILIGNDERFTNIENYLEFAKNNTVQGADAQRTVDLSLDGGNFPQEI